MRITTDAGQDPARRSLSLPSPKSPMGNRFTRLRTPCFAGADGRAGHGSAADVSAPDAACAGNESLGHILSFDGRERPAFAGAIHGLLLPSNQQTLASTSASIVNDHLLLSGSSSSDSSNSFSFRTLQPRQYSSPLDCPSPSSTSASASAVSVARQFPRTDEQILADLYSTRHRRHLQMPKNSFLHGLRKALASAASKLRIAPSSFRSGKQQQETVEAVGNGGSDGAAHDHGRHDGEDHSAKNGDLSSISSQGNDAAGVQWARGKAGEDRIHVVVSEERGWMFVGIYDGFNGPDATDYLLSNLYDAVCGELSGLLSKGELELESGSEEMLQRGNSNAARHREVLDALARALQETEEGYFGMVEARAAESPELAMMGSCVLVMLMKGQDVYLMNVGDSRAVLAHRAEPDLLVPQHGGQDFADIKEEIKRQFDACEMGEHSRIAAVQLTMDHSTSVYKEVRRIRSEHTDDPACIVNGRVKGSLKVTRAFGAGYLKEPRWNRALLEVFRVDYVGTSPYIICRPYLRHHRLSPRDKFLILSSDGLYQYFTNEEVVLQVETFTARYPADDPAKHLSHEILLRAAMKAGLEFHELIEIPHGDRRQYHDDVSILIISLEGKFWRSSV